MIYWLLFKKDSSVNFSKKSTTFFLKTQGILLVKLKTRFFAIVNATDIDLSKIIGCVTLIDVKTIFSS